MVRRYDFNIPHMEEYSGDGGWVRYDEYTKVCRRLNLAIELKNRLLGTEQRESRRLRGGLIAIRKEFDPTWPEKTQRAIDALLVEGETDG